MRESQPSADRTRRIALFVAWVCLWFAQPAIAHEFWIEPQSFRAQTGATIPVRLFVGQSFRGESLPWIAEHFERFYYSDGRGTEDIRAVLGDDPAAALALRAPGRVWIVLRSRHFNLSYDKRGEFDAFLASEGIDHLVPRERRGKVPTKEIYSRFAKSLLLAGVPAPASPPDRAFGLPLELVAETDPYSGRPREFKVKLLYRGAALSGALVTAFSKAVPGRRLEARTDTSGRAWLKLDREGAWLLNAVHLTSAPKNSGAQWETLWASLTFEIM